MSKIEVTQADREAYLSMNMLPEFDAIDVRAGLWDKVTGLQSFARHAHAARIEGARAAIEAAVKEARVYAAWHNTHDDGLSGMDKMATGADDVADEIAHLDPEQIVKGMSQ